MDIIEKIAEELNIRPGQAEAAVRLIDEGNTIPFISRYRKEATGALNDEILRTLDERLRYLRNLEDRKATVIASISEQGMLSDELKDRIELAGTMAEVEDLYRPYKPKRRTRAMIAKEKGLDALARIILKQELAEPLEKAAEAFLSDTEGKEVKTVKEAVDGAKDIIAEEISDNADYRRAIRNVTWKLGTLDTSRKEKSVDEKNTYEMYYEYSEPVSKIPGHRILAINRGEDEKILNVKVTGPDEDIIRVLEKHTLINDNPYTAPTISEAVEDSYKRLIQPAVEREIRSMLTEAAQAGAIKVFGKNLEQILMQPPIAGRTVLGWDPAFRTGCKIAVVDPTGKVLDTTVVYPTAPQMRVDETVREIRALIKKDKVDLISLGNGTASRESEQLIAKAFDIPYVIVSEAGASVYSASKLATEEFPGFDVGQRSATSMARRLQDPLAELVKIDPKSIGVGQYQHDMDQKLLGETLSGVVEDCVNKVGVDLNTASASLLEYVSGISKTLAKNIVSYREQNGRFVSRKELLKVAKLGPKAYEQCAGFMRISGGTEPLDATSVHPESYEAARALLKKLGYDPKEIAQGGIRDIRKRTGGKNSIAALAAELGVGELTLADIVSELEKPARDPRKDMPGPVLRSDVLEMKDLKPGMILKGTVRNVIDFGAFVDIGVHQDGLVHISQLTDRYVKHPLEAVNVGDIVTVKVLGVDLQKQRISLTMII